MKVTFETNIAQLTDKMKARGKAVHAAFYEVEKKWGKDVKKKCIQNSQGPLKESYLRTQHPGLYSVARAVNPAFDAVINKQTGEFAKDWSVVTESTPGKIITTISNDAPYAKFFEGQPRTKMRERPVIDKSIADAFDPLFMLAEAKRLAENNA